MRTGFLTRRCKVSERKPKRIFLIWSEFFFLRPMKLYPLPSNDFNEIADDVFCHLHDDDDVNHGHLPAVPQTDQCFINSIFLILNANLIDGGCLVADSNVIVCKNCHQQVGCLHSSGTKWEKIKNIFIFYS